MINNAKQEMIIAAAQTKPKIDDIEANLEDHYRLSELAAKNGANLVVFPELSLSSYEREKAADLAFTAYDLRLDDLRKLSINKNITIIAGAPINIKHDLYIGAFVIQPNNKLSFYTKQYLHGEENNYFSSSFKYNPVFEIENERFSIAICADINHPKHAQSAKKAGTTIYLAGIFFEEFEMSKAHTTLSNYAKKFSMNVLMSNFTGHPYGGTGGGKSAFWNKRGELVVALNRTDSELLFVEKKGDNWIGKSLKQ